MNFNEAFKIWYRADDVDVSELNPVVITPIRIAYLADRSVMYDSKDPFLDPYSAHCNIAQILIGLTRTYLSSRLKNRMTTDSNNIFSLYAGTSGLKIQKELMELVHPESKLYGIKFIRWMAHRIKNHLHGRDLFYDEFKNPQPPAPEKPEECLAMHDGWTCTKDKGHSGDHEAGDGSPDGQIFCIWPNVPKAPVEPEECAEMHNDWMCTKDKGHSGDHEAGGPGNEVIYATWPNKADAPTPFDNILIVHECKVPWYNRISIPMKIWKDVQMHQRHWKGEKIRITIEKI